MQEEFTKEEKIARVLHDGQRTMPSSNERPALVCKPSKVESWRIFRIMTEFVEGFDVIRRYTLAATFFGSARIPLADDLSHKATELAERLAKDGFAVITGGSSGIMQAANKGAYDVGGASVGLNIALSDNQEYNAYLTDRCLFDHFFVRKVMLTYASEVYIYFPGGFGTLDELFEIVTLVQTKKIRKVPIILFSKKYWSPILQVLETVLFDEFKTIDKEDMDLYTLVDTVDEAYDVIKSRVVC